MKYFILIFLIAFPIFTFANWEEITTPNGKILLRNLINVNNALISHSPESLYRSFDDGETWEKINSNGLDSIIEIDFIYSNNKDLYLLSYKYKNKKGIFKSNDYGESFELITEEQFDEMKYYNDKFYLSRSNLLVTEDFINYDTLLKGKDNYTFDKIEFVNDVIIYYDKGAYSSNPQVINDGVVFSDDNGETWQEWNLGLFKNSALYNDVHFTDSISFIATSSGLFKSEGIGKLWKPIDIPSKSKDIISLIFYDDRLYYANDDDEIYFSEDFGSSWTLFEQNEIQRINNMMVIDDRLFIVGIGLFEIVDDSVKEIDLYDSGNLLELEFENNIKYILLSYDGIFSSQNNNQWIKLNNSEKTGFYKIRVNDSLILGHYSNSNILYYSRDLGKSWKDTAIIPEPERIFEVNIFDELIAVVTTNKLVYSNDRGQSWVSFNENNPDFNIRFRKIYRTDDNTFLASTSDNGILISKDKCKSWEKITDSSDTNIHNESTFHIGIHGNNLITPKFIGYESLINEFFVSYDFGQTWEIKKFIDNEIYIYDFLSYKENIFMTTYYGFMYSTDFGDTWQEYNENIEMDSLTIRTTFPFRDLDLYDGDLYLTLNDRIMTLPLSELGIEYSSVENTEMRNYLFTYPPYPHPTNGILKMKTHWDNSIPFTKDDVEVYNINGVKINTENDISIQKESAYNGYIFWDVSKQSPGIYFIKVTHGTEIRFSKVIIK